MDERLEKLREITETTLSKEILIPLFSAIHQTEVDFHHGPSEKGKDLILWKNDDYNDLELTVIQVKKLKPNSASAGNQTFCEVCNQLYQAKQAKIAFRDGSKHLPHKVIFVTPYQINARALESNIETFSNMTQLGAKVIDGCKLLELIDEKCPHLNDKLMSPEKVTEKNILDEIHQDKLIEALNIDSNFCIDDFYVDLEFCFGDTLASNVLVGKEKFEITLDVNTDQFTILEKANKLSEAVFFEGIFEKNADELKNTYQNQKLLNQKSIEKNKELTKKILSAENQITILSNSLKNFNKTLKTILNKANLESSIQEKVLLYTGGIESNRDFASKYTETELKKSFVQLIQSETKAVNTKLFEDIQRSLSEIQKLITAQTRLKNEKYILKKETTSSFPLIINLHGIRKAISKREHVLFQTLETKDVREEQIREAVIELNKIGATVKDLAKNQVLRENFPITQNIVKPPKRKVNLPLQKIFDSRTNLLLVGEAGAGKTTTLGNYYKNTIGERPVLFLSLAKLFSSKTLDPKYILDTFISLIQSYFHHPKVDKDYITNLFHQKSIVLLLDGYDEVIAKVPELKALIKELIGTYPDMQVIVSSRPTDKKTIQLPLTQISLLPFTTDQRNAFITKWFETKPENLTTKIINHLEKNRKLSTVVKFPFLIATLCSLAEKEVPLPKSESKLYEKRLDLLLGRYDIYKKVQRNKIEFNDLLYLARKIAFFLHKSQKRSDSKQNIISHLSKDDLLTFSKEKIKKAVNELIDPCNVLIVMDDIGQVGFGHLRHQEYLVALEFNMNKDIDVIDYLSKYWWEGALVLYSQLADSINFIINHIKANGADFEHYQILEKIVCERSKKERKMFLPEIEKMKSLASLEDLILYERPI